MAESTDVTYRVILHNGEPPGSAAGHFDATRVRVMPWASDVLLRRWLGTLGIARRPFAALRWADFVSCRGSGLELGSHQKAPQCVSTLKKTAIYIKKTVRVAQFPPKNRRALRASIFPARRYFRRFRNRHQYSYIYRPARP